MDEMDGVFRSASNQQRTSSDIRDLKGRGLQPRRNLLSKMDARAPRAQRRELKLALLKSNPLGAAQSRTLSKLHRSVR